MPGSDCKLGHICPYLTYATPRSNRTAQQTDAVTRSSGLRKLFWKLRSSVISIPLTGHHLYCHTPLSCTWPWSDSFLDCEDDASSSDFLHVKREYFLQGRPESDEPWISLRDVKMEEKIYDAHRVMQRSVFSYYGSPRSALIYKL